MKKQLDYATPGRTRQRLWWRITEIGNYVTVGLVALTAVVFLLRVIRLLPL